MTTPFLPIPLFAPTPLLITTTTPTPSQIHGLSFLVIVANMLMYKYINKCVQSIQCLLLVYDFKADQLALNNQLRGSSMGKNISSTFSSPSLPIVNCLEVERHVKLPPLHFSMYIT